METAFLNRQRNIFRARYNNYLADEKVKNPGLEQRDRAVYEAEVRVWKHSFGEKTPFPGKFPDPNAAVENISAGSDNNKEEEKNENEDGDITIENPQEKTQPKIPHQRPLFRPKVNRDALIYDLETQLIPTFRCTSTSTSSPFPSLSTQPQTTEEQHWPKGRDLESKRNGNAKIERTMGRPMPNSFMEEEMMAEDVEWQMEMERTTAERRARRVREHPEVHRRMEIGDGERRERRGGRGAERIAAVNPDRETVRYNPIHLARGMGELGFGVEKESDVEKGESATGEEIVEPATTVTNKRQREEDDEEEAPPGRERIRQRIRRNPGPPRVH